MVHCPLCQHPIKTPPRIFQPQTSAGKKRLFGQRDFNDIYHCSRCDSGFQHPFPQKAHTPDGNHSTNFEQWVKPMLLEQGLNVTRNYCDAGRLLALGRHGDEFAQLAQNQGFDAQAMPLEYGASNFTFAAQANLQHSNAHSVVHSTTHEPTNSMQPGTKELSGKSYEVVCAWDEFHKLPDPLGFLEQVHHTLKAGGWFVFSTLNLDHWTARLLGSNWPWYHQTNLVYFTLKGLSNFLWQAGMQMVHHEAVGHEISWHSMQTLLKPSTQVNTKWLSGFGARMQGLRLRYQLGDMVIVVAKQKGG